MHWTSANLVLVVIGIAAVLLGVLLFRFRIAANKFFLDQQTSMFGQKVGDMMKRNNNPMLAVGVPAIFAIVIGAVFILFGVFGHPH